MHTAAFVIYARSSGNQLVVQNLGTLERVTLASVEELPGHLREWLQSGRTTQAGKMPPLTPSEARVAHLVAEGLQNKQIAAALGVRPRTVETHLTNAYRKLGVTSRRLLAAAVQDSRTHDNHPRPEGSA
jgi:DNA-binding CsgD family transcriptional regulator